MFDWNDFLILAKELAQRNDEASLRTAISRTYYAVYWKARMQLEKDGFSVRFGVGKGSHEQVWDEYNNRQGKENKAIFKYGDELKKNRHRVDYKPKFIVSRNLVDDSLRLANNVLFNLSQVQPNTN